MPGVAFAEIIILWLAIAFNIFVFYPLSPLAAMLLLPYLLWVSYASYLNWGIWRLNRTPA
jgi:tryptophan-rich sensory protein